ncbi:CC_3452 family protein [Sphingosinithalassobacter sp. LHW66-3]|uniref:CC_3452 family protein n=1 Tax=Sphingosinithalassobacter sp. LHW66-3 TaxID=3424718 RepID=UPI003D6BDFD4
MKSVISVAAAVAASLAMLPAVASAQSANGYYSATPVSAPANDSLVTRNVIWRCGGGTCVAAKGTARDAIMCQLLAREVGVLTEFKVEGEAFDAEALERCNARARS